MHEIFGVLAGIFSLIGYGLYILAMLRGETKPSKTTWWIWVPLVVTLFFSAKASGAEETLWVAKSEMVGITAIALLSLKFGKKEREKGEWFCILGSAVSLMILWVFKAPAVALIAALATDSFALWPTIQKTIRNPEEEDRTAWVFTQTANLFNLFAISTLAFGDIVYPVWLFALDGIIIWFLFSPKKRKVV
ncbi:MAG: hypothetical protein A3E02_00500 [Candidatus Zambryskibacteria bacterium RIFCSPHIGHO2_12_FULL_38_34]|uniref:Uncharacterized protein n=1 Tax=Candidatus Zambryskibacteria bacterium RIFCSPLOWO2_12_FULL_39_16 TaxID=1802775 RepID=A0A1G2USI5_9BACT|nr:MAG: hypothetical protein A3D37_00795 [Candidatus Zambryskibacteria bacterium RIFCSPHIGHO2_02_FULL_38_22]OHA98365.1 MAG: hypothetical protein A3E02_00500 [Candidatus Zambryskibacteria bacterium RIFCSPHIGHO2_12_FULL_38_34]OHB08378.1 MAG: hypothetical protein A3I19_01160 [Candidatus Zambryskibacteria bacterium RIFCSPLOWO2_02_FULL_38_13]OHB12354.1 MAG: hypothetical protein A3G46_00200 [Candidatus Zambryskibacteria bacterium RIFCSPLOWO2_12_FULL_39_16]